MPKANPPANAVELRRPDAACTYQLRIGQRVPAERVIGGEAMCADCVAGKPLRAEPDEARISASL
jgi:hypothetical protein